jgi:hypothetical protein
MKKYFARSFVLPSLFLCLLTSASASETPNANFARDGLDAQFKLVHFSLPMNKYIEFLAKDAGYQYHYTENNCLSTERAESGFKHNEYTNTVGARLREVAYRLKNIAAFTVDVERKQIILSCQSEVK